MKNYVLAFITSLLAVVFISIELDQNKPSNPTPTGVEITNLFSSDEALIPELLDVPVKQDFNQERILAIKEWILDEKLNTHVVVIYTNEGKRLFAGSGSLALILDQEKERIIKSSVNMNSLLNQKIGNMINFVTHNDIITDVIVEPTFAKIQ